FFLLRLARGRRRAVLRRVLRAVLALAAAAPVVGRVEARAFEVDRDRVQHPLDRTLPADLTRRRRRIGHALEELENVALRAFVLVDRHGRTRLAAASEVLACAARPTS